MDSIKLAAIKDWLSSKNVKKVRCFIGFCNFYKKFIPGFSDLAKTLLLLTHKNTQWQWTSDHAKAFTKIKDNFLKQPVLAFPDHNKSFFVMTGTFLTTSRDVLMQKDTNGDLHPCTYFSKIFAPAKQNYDIYNQELLAIIHALTKWCQYLTSTTHPVTTLTDHKNLLTYFNKPQCLSHQQAHWQMFLQDYDLIWDPLTPSLKKTLDIFSDNILQVLLPDLQINMLDTTLASKIAKSTPSNHLSSMP